MPEPRQEEDRQLANVEDVENVSIVEDYTQNFTTDKVVFYLFTFTHH